jgi:hypothetical protein
MLDIKKNLFEISMTTSNFSAMKNLISNKIYELFLQDNKKLKDSGLVGLPT